MAMKPEPEFLNEGEALYWDLEMDWPDGEIPPEAQKNLRELFAAMGLDFDLLAGRKPKNRTPGDHR
jgi:hypothetical protein